MTRCKVVLTPGWERECRESNTQCLKDCGTKGRCALVDVSQMIMIVEAGNRTSSSVREGEDLTVAKSGSLA